MYPEQHTAFIFRINESKHRHAKEDWSITLAQLFFFWGGGGGGGEVCGGVGGGGGGRDKYGGVVGE